MVMVGGFVVIIFSGWWGGNLVIGLWFISFGWWGILVFGGFFLGYGWRLFGVVGKEGWLGGGKFIVGFRGSCLNLWIYCCKFDGKVFYGLWVRCYLSLWIYFGNCLLIVGLGVRGNFFVGVRMGWYC